MSWQLARRVAWDVAIALWLGLARRSWRPEDPLHALLFNGLLSNTPQPWDGKEVTHRVHQEFQDLRTR